MAYSQVLVSAGSSSYTNSRFTITRASDGRLWVAYMDNGRQYIRARYSDDDGANWSSEQTVVDWGGSSDDLTYQIRMGLDDNPLIFSYKDFGNGSDIDVRRWNGSSWAYQGALDCGSSEPSPNWDGGAAVASTGRWYVVLGTGSTTAGNCEYAYSDDDGVNWSARKTVYTGDSTSAMFRQTRGSHACVIDSDDVMHVVWGDYRTTSGKHVVFYTKGDVSSDPTNVTWDTPVVIMENPGAFSSNDLPAEPHHRY